MNRNACCSVCPAQPGEHMHRTDRGNRGSATQGIPRIGRQSKPPFKPQRNVVLQISAPGTGLPTAGRLKGPS